MPLCEKELLHLKSELEGLEKKEGEMQATMVDLRHGRDKHLTKLKDCEQKIKYYTREVCSLQSFLSSLHTSDLSFLLH